MEFISITGCIHMSLKLSELENLLEYMDVAETWIDSNLDTSIKIYLHRAFKSPVRLVHRSGLILSYNLDLKRELDPTYKECLIFIVRLSADLEPDLLNELLESIRYVILKEGLSSQPHFIFLFGGDHNLKRYFEDEFWGSVISDEKGLKDWLKKSILRSEIISKLKIGALEMTKCPFHYLGPCSPDMFVGREKLIKEILLDSIIGYAIAGGRRIGKTSLLFKIQSDIKEGKKSPILKSYCPIYIDCSNFFSFKDLMKAITLRLFPKYYLEHAADGLEFTFDRILSRATGLFGKKVFLLLDEMDPLVEKAKERSVDSTVFFNSLRSEVHVGRLRLVITGFRELSKMIQNTKHPFYNICEKKHLGVLEKEDVKELIARTFFRIGIKIEPMYEIISQLYEFTAGHPSVVQFVAKQLFQDIQGNTITLKDFKRVIKSEKSIDFILDNFVLNTTPIEKLVCLLTIEKEEFNSGNVFGIFSFQGIQPDDLSTKVYNALRNMTSNNILVHNHGQYKFLYPMMRSIIKTYYKSPELISTLKREVEK
jgi:hypothetical protein